jgi:hypothetical protein
LPLLTSAQQLAAVTPDPDALPPYSTRSLDLSRVEAARWQNYRLIEQPGAHHVLTENMSSTERARLLVVFVSDTGAELKVDDPHS